MACICGDQVENSDDMLKIVIEVVHRHSGGIKFTELISEMTTTYRERFKIGDDFVDKVESIIRASNELKVLDYTSYPLNRSKMFVYTP